MCHDLPMHIVRVREETDTERVYRRITPSLIEETTSIIQVLEVSLVFLTTEKIQVTNLEVRPEVTGGVSIAALSMFGPRLVIGDPIQHVVVAQVGGVCGQESASLGPEGGDRLRSIVEADGETIGLVVILHVAEHIVVDIAEELDVGLDAPVVAIFL